MVPDRAHPMAHSRAVWMGSALGVATAIVTPLIAKALASPEKALRRLGLVAAGCGLAIGLMSFVALGPGPIGELGRRRLGRVLSQSQFESRLIYWYATTNMHSPFSPLGVGRLPDFPILGRIPV